MAKTPSNMIPLGTKAPDFSLIDTKTGSKLSLNELKSDIGTVIMFICNHCPFVVHIHNKLLDVITHYQKKGISFVAISANDAAKYPDDAPEKMKAMALQHNYSFPYLHDETQAIAKAYQAACTPDFYVFDKNLACVYRGRFDDATPGNDKPVTGKDLIDALDALIDNKPIRPEQFPSVGCNIKWKN